MHPGLNTARLWLEAVYLACKADQERWHGWQQMPSGYLCKWLLQLFIDDLELLTAGAQWCLAEVALLLAPPTRGLIALEVCFALGRYGRAALHASPITETEPAQDGSLGQ